MSTITMSLSLIAALLAGCDGGSAAALDAPGPDAPLIPGDWSCAGVPWATTAPDPLTLRGNTIERVDFGTTSTPLGGALVEIYSDTNALLGQATTSTQFMTRGNYSVSIATGGVARTVYRKASAAGYLDDFTNDPTPVSMQNTVYTSEMQTAAARDSYYQLVGATPEPGKGTLQVFFYDCSGRMESSFIAGITVEPPEGSTAIYYDAAYNLAPTLTETTSSGQVLLLNVAAGPLDLVAHAGPLLYRPWPLVVHADVWNEAVRVP